jgi:predicted RNase H-like HicB family nuclease
VCGGRPDPERPVPRCHLSATPRRWFDCRSRGTGRTVEEARELLLDAAREMIASYRDEGREPPIGGGHVEQLTIDVAAA